MLKFDIKEILRNVLDVIQKIIYLNSKYKLRLVGMLSVIFGVFLYTLIFIVNTKALGSMEPLLWDIDTSTTLGKFLNSGLFKKSAHLLFGYWNFGPSYETLLGLMVVSFSVLMLLILLSSYIKLFLIPLSIISTYIFYSCFKVIKQNYVVENATEIFSKWGITLKNSANIELWENAIDDTISSSYMIWESIISAKYKVTEYDLTNIDLIALKERIIGLNIQDKTEMLNYINKYLGEAFNIKPEIINKGWNFGTGPLGQIGEFGATGSGWSIVLGILVVGAIIGLYCYSGAIMDWVGKVDSKVDSVKQYTDAVDSKATIIGDGVGNAHENTANLANKLSELAKLVDDNKNMDLAEILKLQGQITTLGESLLHLEVFEICGISIKDLVLLAQSSQVGLLELIQRIEVIEQLLEQSFKKS